MDTPFAIERLLTPGAFPHPTTRVEIRETHISWVLLTDELAYKIKKPIRTPFLDYSTLSLRRDACLEELRLNQRYSPDIYLSVVPLIEDSNHLRFAWDHDLSNKSIVEYAVAMKRFPEANVLSRMLASQSLEPKHIRMLADELTEVHQQSRVASIDSEWATPMKLLRDAEENFIDFASIARSRYSDVAESISDWTHQTFHKLHDHWFHRRLDGHIRECHGDLHLGNLVWWNERVALFDAIEFNPSFRWIDTINDLAFTLMDLEHSGRPDLAGMLINRYLERTGDYSAIAVLDWYLVYRAMVRTKVTAMRANQETEPTKADNDWLQVEEYIEWANRWSGYRQGGLVITYGLSGSGKSYGTESLLATGRAIRIRSDIERKRMDLESDSSEGDSPWRASPTTGLPSSISKNAANHMAADLYSSPSRDIVYDRLLAIAQTILDGNYWVIVDATFLSKSHRNAFRKIAQSRNIPFYILPFDADVEVLCTRIEARQRDGSDPSDANVEVLRQQIQQREPLADSEMAFVTTLEELTRVIERV